MFFSTAVPTEVHPLSLHDALPIYFVVGELGPGMSVNLHAPNLGPRLTIVDRQGKRVARLGGENGARSEEHTSELQSHSDLVCRLLLEKKTGAARCPITRGDAV